MSTSAVCQVCYHNCSVPPSSFPESFHSLKYLGESLKGLRLSPCSHVICLNCLEKSVSNSLKKAKQTRTRFSPMKSPCCYRDITTILSLYLSQELRTKFEDQAEVDAGRKIWCSTCDSVTTLAETMCSSCRVTRCGLCKLKIHPGLTCEQSRSVSKGEWDREMASIASRFGYRRCPSCGIAVEKISGCLHVACRCGCVFCYT